MPNKKLLLFEQKPCNGFGNWLRACAHSRKASSQLRTIVGRTRFYCPCSCTHMYSGGAYSLTSTRTKSNVPSASQAKIPCNGLGNWLRACAHSTKASAFLAIAGRTCFYCPYSCTHIYSGCAYSLTSTRTKQNVPSASQARIPLSTLLSPVRAGFEPAQFVLHAVPSVVHSCTT